MHRITVIYRYANSFVRSAKASSNSSLGRVGGGGGGGGVHKIFPQSPKQQDTSTVVT